MVRQFTARAERCRFFGERTVTSHADGAIRVWDETGTLVAQTQAAAGVERSWRMALGERTLVASTERVQAWDITPYGRRNVAANLLGWGRGNAYVYSEDTLVELDADAITAGPKLRLGNNLPLAVSDSLGLAVFRRGQAVDAVTQELSLMALRPGEAPREQWRWKASPGRAPSGITFSPDERHVAIDIGDGARDGSLLILDAVSGKVVRDLPKKSSILFTPTNEVLTFDGSNVVVVSLRDDSERAGPAIKLQPGTPAVAAFSRDGRHVALGCPAVRLGVGARCSSGLDSYASAGGAPTRRMCTSLSFRHDGLALLTSSTDGTTHAWDLATRKETLRIPAPGRDAERFYRGGRDSRRERIDRAAWRSA